MKRRTNANQIIETTVRFGIINLYAAPDTSWTKAIRGSADDRAIQSNVVRAVMAYKPHPLVFSKCSKRLVMVNGQRRHISI